MSKLWAWPLAIAIVTFEIFGAMIVFFIIMWTVILLGTLLTN